MIRQSIFLLCSGLSFLLIMIGCQQETPTSISHQEKEATSIQNQTMGRLESSSCIVNWNYDDNDPQMIGPSYWGDLEPGYSLCNQGLSQSPINIVTEKVVPQKMRHIKFRANRSNIEIKHCGQTIRIDIYGEGRSCLFLDNKKFSLDHIHIHTPSEHQINGKHAPLEFHLVHKAKDGEIAVVGVLVKAGKKHRNLAKFWNRLPELYLHPNGNKTIIEPMFKINSLLPRRMNRGTYRYNGSLTTPPCSEGLRWIVLKKPIQMSIQQIRVYQDFFYTPNASPFPNGNRRSIKPLNDRQVTTEKSIRYKEDEEDERDERDERVSHLE